MDPLESPKEEWNEAHEAVIHELELLETARGAFRRWTGFVPDADDVRDARERLRSLMQLQSRELRDLTFQLANVDFFDQVDQVENQMRAVGWALVRSGRGDVWRALYAGFRVHRDRPPEVGEELRFLLEDYSEYVDDDPDSALQWLEEHTAAARRGEL
jgi:hypothetical protein